MWIGGFFLLWYDLRMIYLAADHRGFQLKEAIKRFLIERGIVLEDVGAATYAEGDDYVDFARVAAEKIAANLLEHKGIFLCGSGHGVDMVANKYHGVRAALCWNVQVAKQSREHEDANALVLPADWLDEAAVEEIVTVWLGMEFSNEERHVRRLEKIREIEEKNFHG
jgi:ribose 5-phosphate isomerase B